MLPPLPSTVLQNIQLPSGYFINYHVMSQRPVLSYIQEGSGKLFEQLFQIWLKHESGQVGTWQQQEYNEVDMQLFGTSHRHSQKGMMLQQILGEQSMLKLTQASQFAQAFARKGLPYSEFLIIVQRKMGKLPFRQLGLYTMQLLVHYFKLALQSHVCYLPTNCRAKYNCQRKVLLSGGQGHYPDWLQWKADHSGIAIHQTSVHEAEFIGSSSYLLL